MFECSRSTTNPPVCGIRVGIPSRQPHLAVGPWVESGECREWAGARRVTNGSGSACGVRARGAGGPVLGAPSLATPIGEGERAGRADGRGGSGARTAAWRGG